MYEIFEHTADVGIRARATTLEELFADAARGLFSILVANLDAVWPVEEVPYIIINIPGGPHDDMLFDWLNELLFTFETRRVLFSQFEVRFDDSGLTATVRGEPMDRQRHEMDMEVKAITYHGLKVEQTDAGWLAEVIVDI